MFLFTIKFICSCLIVVTAHEAVHFFVAKLFKLSPSFYITWFGTPIVEYKNNDNYFGIFMVSVSAPIGIFVITSFLPQSSQFDLIKLMGLLNIVNLLPITTDGEVAIYALVRIWKKIKK
ncbi:hypothetical protein [Lactobacillus apis]|uniref:Peptidase family M50 n=1 Tax=Lactobacillus apis TaxID=303541 RepID=A0A0F4LV86_9LACO|nr:hypothetical protein [Lactobacillus apis]KJY62687.1 hypothetical protein JF72_00280 [Lactobacillus apis]